MTHTVNRRIGVTIAAMLAGTALVSPARASNIIVNTDLGTITVNGVDSGGFFNGVQFAAVLSGGTMQFIFNGDFTTNASDTVTGVGSNFASFRALNNANVQGTFNFSAIGQIAGPGGGGGGPTN
jgi:hypothetical protein